MIELNNLNEFFSEHFFKKSVYPESFINDGVRAKGYYNMYKENEYEVMINVTKDGDGFTFKFDGGVFLVSEKRINTPLSNIPFHVCYYVNDILYFNKVPMVNSYIKFPKEGLHYNNCIIETEHLKKFDMDIVNFDFENCVFMR